MVKNSATLDVYGNTKPLDSAVEKSFKRIESRRPTVSLDLGKITSDFTKFEQSLDAATARVVAFTATTSLLYGVGSAFKRLTQDAIQIESVMARIQSIFGSTAAETKQFQSAIFGLANDVGLSFFQVAEAAEEFSRQGLSLNKTLEATRAAAVVAKLSGAELKGVIEGLTATLSTFNDGTLDYIQVANKLVALDSAFATSAAGITEGLKRVSGVAVQAGLSFDETAAAITSLKQVTGRSEAVIGNSLKSIFTSLQTEKVQKDLATLGVETKDASGEFRNLVDVLSDLSKVYGTLGDAQKTVIAQRIGKTYQANAFQGILRTFETGDYEKALATSKNAGSSAEDRLEKLNQTTQSALQRFSNNITQLGGNLGEKLGKPLLDTVVGYMNSAVEAGNKIFGGSGLGDALVGGLRNVLEGPGVVILTFSVAKLLTRIIKESGQAVKSIAGLSGAKENILRIDQFITTNLSEQNKVELERIKTLTSVAAQQKAILDLMNRQLVTQEKMRSQGILPTLGVTALQSLGPAAASKAAKKIPNRGKGELPEVNKAILREAIDIRNGVGGARITASPMVKTLNLGKGPEKVVVNSDEKIVKNFAGSGQDAVLNREMMGYALGNIPKGIRRGSSVFTEKHFKNKDTFYRVVHGDAAFNDIVNSGLVRTNASSKSIEGLSIFEKLKQRPTAFPSFAKSGAAFSYAQSNPNHFIITTKSDSIKQSTVGRHGKGSTYFPTGKGGNHLESLPGGDVRVFKHIGEGKYKIVYDRGKLVNKEIHSFAKGKLTKRQLENLESKRIRDLQLEKTALERDSKRRAALAAKRASKISITAVQKPALSSPIAGLIDPNLVSGLDEIQRKRSEIEARKESIRNRLASRKVGLSGFQQFERANFIQPARNILPELGGNATTGTYTRLNPLPTVPSAKDILPALGGNDTRGGYTQFPPLTTSSRANPILSSPSPNYTPISPIRAIKAPVPPPEKTGTRPSVDVQGNSLFSDAAKRASAEAGLNRNRERADRISNLIDSKKGLTQNAKQFVNANRGLFGESSLSSFDKRNRTFRERIGGIGSKISNGVKNFNPGAAAGAGFAISFIGGSIAEGYKTKFGEDTQSSRGIGGIAQGVGIGAQLALFGKTAGIVGLVAGAAVGLNTAFGENLDRLNGLKEKHDGLIKTYREEGESISLFSNSFQDLNDALDSGSEKAAKFAKEGIKKALEGISDEGLKNALVSAKTQEDVSRVVSENQNRRNAAISLSESKVNIGDLLQSNRQGFFGGLVRKNTDSFGNFLGLNEGLDVGQIEKIASSLAGSIDVSKFSERQRKVYSEKGVSASALPPEVQAALREVESRFSGGSAKILSEISKKLIPKLTDNSSIISDLEKKARKEQDFTNLISGSAQKTNFSIFEKLIKSSLAASLSEISLQGAKPFTSEIAFAESQFAIDKSRRSQDLASKNAGLNASLIEKAQELTKGRNLDFGQLGKIQGAFSKFGETQDVGAFLKDFEGILGTDSKELVKFAQGQFLELKKLSAETAAGNQEADARQRTLIEELKRGQRATLFGGGLNKFDRGQANPGLIEILKGPKYNKFNDPTRPGFGLNEKTGRKTFSLGEYAQEESKTLDANESRYDKIIQRAQYLKESGYFGVEPTADTPDSLKDTRRRLLEQERKPLVEALIGKRQKFAKDLALSESGSYVSAINADSKRITGGIAITTEQKKVIADAIKSGSYDTAIGALDESTKNLTKDYGVSGKTDELGKIDAFRTFLEQQKENASNIQLAAEEQAKTILPDQTLEGQNIKLLTEIKDQEVKANENLSKLAELMSQVQTKDLNLSKTTAVGEGISELSSLEMKLAEKNSPLEFDKLKKDLEFDIKRGAIEGNPLDPSFLSNFGGDGSSVSPESLGNYFKYKNKYENPSALEKIYSNRIGRFSDQKSIDRDLESIKSKASGASKIKDELEKSNVLDSLIESIKGLKDELGKRLDSGKTSKIDQNINLDINATVAGTNILASEDFKNSLTAFVGSYVKNVWKENTGNIMIEPPSKNTATA